ncbi:hypothetical protein [Flavobacterium profundi]|uniref:hypothetical protein n=1 Tax=Flavobacterium profundi TaxID=1774945 RepID=UPI0015E8188B|nr:hypothetical protein [Flavobacterium profundi]
MPTFIGVYLSTKYIFLNNVWKEIISDSKNNSFSNTVSKIFVFFVVNLVLSFIVFTTPPQLIWNYINYYKAKNQLSETYITDVTGISTKTNKASPRFYFNFNGHSESVKASFKYVKAHEDFKKFQIRLLIRKGVWDEYLLEDWEIISKW